MTPKALSREYLTIRAVKNRLCRIDDDLMKLQPKNKEIIKIRSDVDGCIASLEKLLTPSH